MHSVLIIDDEKPVRQAIAALGHWEELGIAARYEAVEGESGLQILREKQPEIVLVDMKMPNMDGAQFLEIAHREFPGVKYIVISGYDNFEYTRRAIQAQVLDYLLKPVVEAELNQLLQLAVAQIAAEKAEGARQAGAALPFPDAPHPAGAEKINLAAIKTYIDQHYDRDIKLSFFAERYFLSKEYLSKLFKEAFGYNIYEYVLRVRMEKAREMLADPALRVAVIAEHLGYRDQNYFSRAFKTYYGISPTEYRDHPNISFL